jgi:hypothetical protein
MTVIKEKMTLLGLHFSRVDNNIKTKDHEGQKRRSKEGIRY